jgi:hypothetical protein
VHILCTKLLIIQLKINVLRVVAARPVYEVLAHVGAFHSATGAIESALKNVSPNGHCIARQLAADIKMQLLGTAGTVVTSRYCV